MDGLLFPQKQPPWLLPAGDYELDWTHPLAEGLVGYWPLNGNAVDLSIYGNNGTLVNAPTSVIGVHGPAMNFNGSNQYVTIPYISAYNAANFTWAGWIKTSTYTGNGNCVMALANYSSSSDNGATVIIYANDLSIGYKNGGNISGGPNVGLITDGKWHHFAFVGGTANGQTNWGYLDGVLIATATNSAAWSWTSGSALRLAISGDGYWTDYNGAMMGVTVYNTNLSAAQVARLHAEPFAMLRPISRRIYYSTALGVPLSGVQGVSGFGTLQEAFPINNATPIGAAGTGSVGTLTSQIAPVAHVGFGGTSSGGTSSGINTTGATLLVMTASTASNVTIPTPSDSYNNTWIKVLSQASNGTSASTVLLYYVLNPTVGTGHTFTFSGTGTDSCAQVTAWSGVTTSDTPLEPGATTAASASASSIATGSITPTQNSSLIIAAYTLASVTGSPTINDSFAVSDQTAFSSGVTYGGGQAHLIQTTAAAVNPTWTLGGTGQAATAIAAFGSAATPVNLEVSNVWREVLLEPTPPPLEVSNVWREVLLEPPAPPLEVSNVWQEVLIQTYPVPLSIAAENKPPQFLNIIRQNAQTYDAADQEESYAARRLLFRNTHAGPAIPSTSVAVTGVNGTGAAGSLSSFEIDIQLSSVVGSGLAEPLTANVSSQLTGLFGTGEAVSLVAGLTFAGVNGTGIADIPSSYEIDANPIAAAATGVAETLASNISVGVVGVEGESEIGILVAGAASSGVFADGVANDPALEIDATFLSVFGSGMVGAAVRAAVVNGVTANGLATSIAAEIAATFTGVYGTGVGQNLFPKLIASTTIRETFLAEQAILYAAGLARETVLGEDTNLQASSLLRETVLTEEPQVGVSNVIREAFVTEIAQVNNTALVREAFLAEAAQVNNTTLIREVWLTETSRLNVTGLVREILVTDSGFANTPIVLVVT